MNIATGSLVLLGLLLLVIGVVSKFLGLSLLQPYFSTYSGYFIAANACLLIALTTDRFQKK